MKSNQKVVVALMRVSCDSQSNDRQELAIRKWADANDVIVTQFIATKVSSRKSEEERGLNFINDLKAGDKLIIQELSRLGRSISQLIRIVNDLVARGIHFHSLNENLHFTGGKLDITSKTILTVFSLLSEIDRDLVSSRTKQALASKKASGVILGRPKGTRSSKLDSRTDEIQNLLNLGVSKASIAKMVGVSAPAVHNFIKTRNLKSQIAA